MADFDSLFGSLHNSLNSLQYELDEQQQKDNLRMNNMEESIDKIQQILKLSMQLKEQEANALRQLIDSL